MITEMDWVCDECGHTNQAQVWGDDIEGIQSTRDCEECGHNQVIST